MNGPMETQTEAISYLDSEGSLPTDRLELYFMLKKALKHVLLVGAETTRSAGIRDGAPILARFAGRLSVLAEHLAKQNEEETPQQSENRALSPMSGSS